MTRSPPCATTHLRICSPGKTTFIKFMLARLISAHQVVLLYSNFKVHLFYHGQVYTRPAESGFDYLPRHQKTRYCPIWALIDVDSRDQGPPITPDDNIWPIQMSCPNPVRWKSWRKQNRAVLLGMPLWNMEELMEGYVFSQFSFSAIDPGHAVR